MNGAVSHIRVVDSAQLPKGTHALQEGSLVTVKVLSQTGGGYTVSFAGRRLMVQSKQSLAIGKSFIAQIRFNNNIVELVPQKNARLLKKGLNHYSQLGADARLITLFEQLELPADTVSLRILQFLKESLVPFNKKMAKKARDMGKLFTAAQEDSAEISLLLEEKGIFATKEQCKTLLKLLNRQFEDKEAQTEHSNDTTQNLWQEENFSHADSHRNQNEDTAPKPKSIQKINDNFLTFLYTNANFLETFHKNGLLTIVNHLSQGNIHKVILPFNGCINAPIKGQQLKGTMRFFLNKAEGSLHKVAVSFGFGSKTYYFMIYCFGKKEQWVVQFCVSPTASEQEQGVLQKYLTDFVPKNIPIIVKYDKNLETSGFFSGDTAIPLVDLDA